MLLRAVLFDLDDTLLDHTHSTLAATRSVAALEPAFAVVPFDDVVALSQTLLDHIHPQVVSGRLSFEQARVERYRKLLSAFGGAPERAEELAAAHARAYRAAERVVPGVRALLDHLKQRGSIALAIVSNNTRSEQKAKLRRLELLDYFAELVVAGDHQISKPDPELFAIALRKLGVAAEDCVYIGDNWDSDVCGAAAAGIRPVWLNRFKRACGSDPLGVAELSGFDDLTAVVAALFEPTGRR